jgi:hypothetical protein
MKIEEGRRYICIIGLEDKSRDMVFKKGKIYLSLDDSTLQDSNGNYHPLTPRDQRHFQFYDVSNAIVGSNINKAQERKDTPVYSGVLMYFPDAIRAIAKCSKIGNDQHNAGQPLHWDRSKSTDEHDALTRHLMEAGTVDDDGIRHSAKVAWRALAMLQKELEANGEAPLSQYNKEN